MGGDGQALERVAVYTNRPKGSEGSFWTGGAAPAADANGNIYLVAGNGTFDAASGGPDLGEAYIKLSSAPRLAVQDYFAPFNFLDLNRQDLDVGSAGGPLLPPRASRPHPPPPVSGARQKGR